MRSEDSGSAGATRSGHAVTARTTVVYVSGTGRSGSTLLGNAVGSLPGALSVGEVKLGFRRGDSAEMALIELVGRSSAGAQKGSAGGGKRLVERDDLPAKGGEKG